MIATLLLLITSVVAAPAGPRHAVTEIEPDGELRAYWTASIDGDARRDLIIGVWTESRGRELLVHLQHEDGTFARVPDRRLRVKSDILAFAAADIRDGPGDELLLFTRSACFGLDTARSGYAGNARRLFDWKLVCTIPARKDIVRLGAVVDVDRDGIPDVLAPGAKKFALFSRRTRTAGDRFVERARFDVRRTPVRGGRGRPHRFEFSLETGFSHRRGEPFGGLVSRWRHDDDSGGGNLLDVARWVPAPHIADVDGDGLADVIYLQPGKTLEIYRQRRDGSFPARPDWSGTFDTSGPLRPHDVDGDGLFDLVAGGDSGADETSVGFYRNRGGRFDTATADQVMKFSGYGVKPEIVDLDGDGAPELVVSSYHISTLNTLTQGTIIRKLLIFRRDPEKVFATRAVFQLEEKFSAREVKGLGQRMIFEADIEGTGRHGALVVDRDGALVLLPINDDLSMESEPSWRFVPRHVILVVNTASLNGDRRTDLILRHMRSLTVLVSR